MRFSATSTLPSDKRVLLFLGVIGLLFFHSAMAAVPPAESIQWTEMAMGLFGGLALFLFGMEQMSDALKSALGDQMKTLLAKLVPIGPITASAIRGYMP